MKHLTKFLGLFGLIALLSSPALAQSPATVKLCIPTSATACGAVTASNPLPVSGSFSATLAGFTPNGNYTTLTATAASSASTALPAGTVVAFQNASAIDVSCVLSAGAATATTNKLIVRAGATVYYTVGSNVNAACINQTGVASNVVVLAGGEGLGTAFGGASSGGGGGGAVTMASGAVASGAYASGSIASGAYASGSIGSGAIASGAFASGAVASGAYASGSLASGAVVDITNLSTPITPATATATKGILLGGQYNSTQATFTNGQQGSVQLSARGAIMVNPGAESFPVTNAGTFAVQAAQSGTWTVQPGNTANTTPWLATVAQGGNSAVVKAANTVTSTDVGLVVAVANTNANGQAAAASSSPVVVAKNSGTGSTVAGAAVGTAGTASAEVVTIQGVASMTPVATNVTQVLGSAISATNGLFTNVLQGNAALSATNGLYSNVLQGNAVLSATNGLYANVLQGNAVLSLTNPSFARITDGTTGITVKAASTASVVADTSMVVTLAPATAMTPIAAAASDNHATAKNGAGVAMSVHTSNNSATKNYLRLYDAGTGFNGCNSATGVIFAMEIPPNDSGFSVTLGGGAGIAFTNGLSYCITSGFGLTDTTNATASAIYANIHYR